MNRGHGLPAPLHRGFLCRTTVLVWCNNPPMEIVRDVEFLCDKTYPNGLLVPKQDIFCPIIFGRPFLNTYEIVVDYEKRNFMLIWS